MALARPVVALGFPLSFPPSFTHIPPIHAMSVPVRGVRRAEHTAIHGTTVALRRTSLFRSHCVQANVAGLCKKPAWMSNPD